MSTARARPPLWLTASGIASLLFGAHAIAVWIYLFRAMPLHEDVRMTYVASEAGLRFGWAAMYDQSTLRMLSSAFPPDQQRIDALYAYLHPPLVAWLFAPLTLFSEPAAYLLWTAISLVGLVFAWHLAAPYSGVAKVALLLVALGLWPVLASFYYGQPNMLVIACVAASWWLVKRDRQFVAGLVLAVATSLKPQIIWMLPLVLLVSGRIRAVTGWVIGCAVLGVLTALALGTDGLTSWWHALQANQADPAHTANTLIHFFGFGPLTFTLWLLLGLGAVFVANRQRANPEIVFTAGLLGTTLVAFHFHELDYSVLVLAAWLFLRPSPPLWQRLWLLVGIAAAELTALGIEYGPSWDVAAHGPVIAWTAAWLVILVGSALAPARASVPAYELARTSNS